MIKEKLNKSFINYLSDLFIVVMVVAWILAIIIEVVMAIYATMILSDVSIWYNVTELVSVPLTAGGAIWMIKNSVQHAIAYNRGEQAHMDFPNVEGTEDLMKEEEVEL